MEEQQHYINFIDPGNLFRVVIDPADKPGEMTEPGRDRWKYKLWDDLLPDDSPLFEGCHYSTPCGRDGVRVLAGLIVFLSLRPGDTDSEYVDDYTARQLAWIETDRPDDLSLIAEDLEAGEYTPL